jgi:hypothetical protein
MPEQLPEARPRILDGLAQTEIHVGELAVGKSRYAGIAD